MNNILLVIPAYNEAENLQNVIDVLIKEYPQYDYIIVNDGSTDNTVKVCKSKGYTFLDLPINLGLSGAFQAGARYAFYNDYDFIVQFDGDGQHRPEFIESMINEMKKTNADIVIGSRFLEKKGPNNLRMLGSSFIKAALMLTTGKIITDPTSGMRLYNKKLIKRYANNINYRAEPDTIAYLLRCGIKIKEVQVQMEDRSSGVSYLNFFKSIEYMFHMLISILAMQFARRKEK